MDAGEYIAELREHFPDVWEPDVERQFAADAKAVEDACAKSDPYASAFAELETAEREFAEKGADDGRCCRDRESFARACPGDDADFWLEELSKSDDDERIHAIHAGLLRHWRSSLERARSVWRERMSAERLARLYAEYKRRLGSIRKMLAELAILGKAGLGWGIGAGELVKHDAATLFKWLHMIEGSEELERLCDLLGRLMANERVKELEEIRTTVEYETPRVDASVKEEIAGITSGRWMEDVVPSELAACGDADLETLFDLKFIEGRLMSFEKTGVQFEKRTENGTKTVECEKEDSRGPVILCIDTSASMAGDPEIVAKDVSLGVVLRARNEKRKCYLVKFSTGVEAQNVGDGAPLGAIIEFLSSSANGGTDVDAALEAGIDAMEQNDYRKADLLVVSDFCFGDQYGVIAKRIKAQQKLGSRFYAVIVEEPGSLGAELGFLGFDECDKLQGFDGVWRCNPSDFTLTALEEPADCLSQRSGSRVASPA